MTAQCPRCPEPCLNRSSKICHTLDCHKWKEQKEWHKAQHEARDKQQEITGYQIEAMYRNMYHRGESQMRKMRFTMSAARGF